MLVLQHHSTLCTFEKVDQINTISQKVTLMLVISYHLENPFHFYHRNLYQKERIILKLVLHFGHCTLQVHVNFSITGEKTCSSTNFMSKKTQLSKCFMSLLTGLSIQGTNDLFLNYRLWAHHVSIFSPEIQKLMYHRIDDAINIYL